jgi:hypothetical protein
MNKLTKVLLTVSLTPVLSMGVAAADSATCTIYDTGSNSFNSCNINSDRAARVICDNNIYILDNNNQYAGTGDVTVTSNGDGGNVVSGKAKNNNDVSVSIGASCVAVTPAPSPTPAPTTTPTAPTGGNGGGGIVAQATPQVKVLPTGGVHAGGGGGIKAVSQLLVAGLVASVGIATVGLTLAMRKLSINR